MAKLNRRVAYLIASALFFVRVGGLSNGPALAADASINTTGQIKPEPGRTAIPFQAFTHADAQRVLSNDQGELSTTKSRYASAVDAAKAAKLKVDDAYKELQALRSKLEAAEIGQVALSASQLSSLQSQAQTALSTYEEASSQFSTLATTESASQTAYNSAQKVLSEDQDAASEIITLNEVEHAANNAGYSLRDVSTSNIPLDLVLPEAAPLPKSPASTPTPTSTIDPLKFVGAKGDIATLESDVSIKAAVDAALASPSPAMTALNPFTIGSSTGLGFVVTPNITDSKSGSNLTLDVGISGTGYLFGAPHPLLGIGGELTEPATGSALSNFALTITTPDSKSPRTVLTEQFGSTRVYDSATLLGANSVLSNLSSIKGPSYRFAVFSIPTTLELDASFTPTFSFVADPLGGLAFAMAPAAEAHASITAGIASRLLTIGPQAKLDLISISSSDGGAAAFVRIPTNNQATFGSQFGLLARQYGSITMQSGGGILQLVFDVHYGSFCFHHDPKLTFKILQWQDMKLLNAGRDSGWKLLPVESAGGQ